MTWQVTYRDEDGHSRTAVFEADDRNALFRQLGTNKIQAIRVAEVKSHSALSRSATMELRLSIVKVAVWCIIGIAVAICAFVIVNRIDNAEKGEVRHKRQIPSQSANKHPNTIAAPQSPKSQTVESPEKNVRMYLGQEVVRTEITTNGGIVVERLYTADGKRHRINHVPPSIFKHASDEYLGIILSTPPGMPMAPLPDLSRDGNIEKAFLESLKEPIEINDDDSEETKEIKLKVMAARESMDALLRQGIGFAKVLEQERQIHNENVTVRAQVIAEYGELVRKANTEDAETYRTKINEQLEKMGIEPIPAKRQLSN